jgi:CDP-paratose 2-epimerase
MKILITGGAGFIGSNFARFALELGHSVILLDNFSRPRSIDTALGMENDLSLKIHNIDIRNFHDLSGLLSLHSDLTAVWHLAGQVSYQSSLIDPISDFATNALGTQNILEACRNLPNLQSFVYSSSNKVYGDLNEIDYQIEENRYNAIHYPFGFTEKLPIKPAGPYGVSKFSGELLCAEYAQSFGIPAIAFRQSSITGMRQFATDDQGWVSYFAEKFATDKPYYFTGEGLQVRDILHVRDLFDLFILASKSYSGFDAFNIGGGIDNSISILELRILLNSITRNNPLFEVKNLRSKDQKFFVSDNAKAEQTFKWKPKFSKTHIIEELVEWFRCIN